MTNQTTRFTSVGVVRGSLTIKSPSLSESMAAWSSGSSAIQGGADPLAPVLSWLPECQRSSGRCGLEDRLARLSPVVMVNCVTPIDGVGSTSDDTCLVSHGNRTLRKRKLVDYCDRFIRQNGKVTFVEYKLPAATSKTKDDLELDFNVLSDECLKQSDVLSQPGTLGSNKVSTDVHPIVHEGNFTALRTNDCAADSSATEECSGAQSALECLASVAATEWSHFQLVNSHPEIKEAGISDSDSNGVYMLRPKKPVKYFGTKISHFGMVNEGRKKNKMTDMEIHSDLNYDIHRLSKTALDHFKEPTVRTIPAAGGQNAGIEVKIASETVTNMQINCPDAVHESVSADDANYEGGNNEHETLNAAKLTSVTKMKDLGSDNPECSVFHYNKGEEMQQMRFRSTTLHSVWSKQITDDTNVRNDANVEKDPCVAIDANVGNEQLSNLLIFQKEHSNRCEKVNKDRKKITKEIDKAARNIFRKEKQKCAKVFCKEMRSLLSAVDPYFQSIPVTAGRNLRKKAETKSDEKLSLETKSKDQNVPIQHRDITDREVLELQCFDNNHAELSVSPDQTNTIVEQVGMSEDNEESSDTENDKDTNDCHPSLLSRKGDFHEDNYVACTAEGSVDENSAHPTGHSLVHTGLSDSLQEQAWDLGSMTEAIQNGKKFSAKSADKDVTVSAEWPLSGSLVWAQFGKGRWWPALVVTANAVKKTHRPGFVWVYWLAENKVSQLRTCNVELFGEAYSKYTKQRHGSHRMQLLKIGIQAALSICAGELGLDVSSIPDLEVWACSSDGVAALLRNDEMACTVRELPKCVLEHLNNIAGKHKNNVKHTAVEARASGKPCKEEATADTNVPACNTSQPEQKACWVCGELCEGSWPHPFFEGDVCHNCKEVLLSNLYAFDKDGTAMFCCICGDGGKLFVCDVKSCARAFCCDCVQEKTSLEIVQRVKECQRWQCFVCTPFSQSTHGQLVTRPDWPLKMVKFFLPSIIPQMKDIQCAAPKKRIRVLSLFDGIGIAHVALADLHLDMEVYYAAETNMAATLVSSRQQDVRHLGNVLDINTAKLQDIGPIDLLIGQPPTADLATNRIDRKGFNGPSMLVMKYMSIMSSLHSLFPSNHVYWLMESTPCLQPEYKHIIDNLLGIEGVVWDGLNMAGRRWAARFWGNIPGLYSTVEYFEQNHDRIVKFDLRHQCTENIQELERLYGFPRHYTDVGPLDTPQRRLLLQSASCVPVIKHLLSPLTTCFEIKDILNCPE
ncbi:uncharacterized protein LOC127871820 [Dreissena polymorpha]|uniref:DNA (cytosine-5-)-methyltransferase n=1 Tax=Dreissena polymorpha TaxID=45954 RepID=A0A9D4RA93_DREPO|nr:uncharacterized protein LOC127871820 [Dreissena polymorpha]KAH3859337.1 hypothetical protein DPMN_102056 [Dreissena polymorpha]